MTYKEKKADRRYLNININGNIKLKNTEKTRFIIWNIPAVTTCPYRTKQCEKACYALKAERLYPDCLFSRKTNLKRSLQADFVENMIFTIETELSTKKFKDKKVVFRIHESGDFYSLEYTKKWVAIAKHFENNENIVFMAYTKSIPFILECGYGKKDFPKNLVVRSSIWVDTKPEFLEMTVKNNIPIYTAATPKEMETARNNNIKFMSCPCADCANCGGCWVKDLKNIVVKIH